MAFGCIFESFGHFNCIFGFIDEAYLAYLTHFLLAEIRGPLNIFVLFKEIMCIFSFGVFYKTQHVR